MTNAIGQTDQFIAQTYKRAPFIVERGEGVYLWDTEGNRYLDMVSGIAVMALGHSDPQVSAIIQQQSATLTHVSNLYYTQPQAALAQALVEQSFADRVFFCNSGTEANEAAIKFARKVAYMNEQPQRREIVAFTHAFHGRTMGSLALTPKPQYQEPFAPLMGGVTILPVNDLDALHAHISDQTCAVIVEPIQGEGGVHPVEAEFLQALRAACDKTGALLIFDEVQCGMGRTGQLWAHEFAGVHPDIMTLAKPLAAGLPIGAVLITEKVHDALRPGDHGSTFAGGAIVTAVAQHVLARVSDPTFLAHVQEVSAYLWERLAELNAPQIVEIRGRGLMVGVELSFPVAELVDAAYAKGLLLVGAGTHTLRLLPPLIIDKPQIDEFIDALTTLLQEKGN